MRLKNKLSKIVAMLLPVVVIAISPSLVFAGLGVSPASLTEIYLKPGASYRDRIYITQSDPTADLNIELSKDMGVMDEWVSFGLGEEFIVPSGEQRFAFDIIIDVPADADFDVYPGILRLKATEGDQDVPGGVAVEKGARIDLLVSVSELDIKKLKVRSIEGGEFEAGEPIVISFGIENEGNVLAAPSKVEMTVSDLSQRNQYFFETTDIEAIPAGEQQVVKAYFEHDLPGGEYFADLVVYLDETVIREERIVINLLGDGNAGGSDADSEQLGNQLSTIISGGVIGITVLSVVGIVLTKARSTKKTDTKDDQEESDKIE